jgi:hypothetical protein
VGGAVGFHFFTLLPPGNDNITGVRASVDGGMKVARGGVLEVAAPLAGVIMGRGVLDLRDLEGFMPFRCQTCSNNLIPLLDPRSHE